MVLAGRSVPLDPDHHAYRADLADIRLAGRVFAPHYAAPLARSLNRAVVLRREFSGEATALAELLAGEAFEVLELARDSAWGVAPARGLVGYIPASAVAEG